MFFTYHHTPIGDILIAGDKNSISVISFPQGNKQRHPESNWQNSDKSFKAARTQLDEYFSGKRQKFDLNLQPQGTEFQLQVWNALLNIPYGETTSYGELALSINRPKASRAVGAANGANPIPIVLPCHRVIGSSGALTGFGGGIKTKQWLLAHEQQNLPESHRSRQQYQFSF